MTKRFTTRTRHPASAPSQLVAQVQDPAVREILLTRRRALLAEVAAIARHCGFEPDAPDDEAAWPAETLDVISTLAATE